MKGFRIFFSTQGTSGGGRIQNTTSSWSSVNAHSGLNLCLRRATLWSSKTLDSYMCSVINSVTVGSCIFCKLPETSLLTPTGGYLPLPLWPGVLHLSAKYLEAIEENKQYILHNAYMKL